MEKDSEKRTDIESLESSCRQSISFHQRLETKLYTFFLPLLQFEAWLNSKLGIEAEAIERKRGEDRKPVKWYDELGMAFLWASGNLNLPCCATGMLGAEFGLSLRQSLVIIFFGNLIGSFVTSYCATFGAPTGLRQMSVSRYSFGWFPSKLIALVNTVQQIGWSSVGAITAGLALTAVADGHISIVVGIIIVAVAALVIGIFGLRLILLVEKYSWCVFFIVFLIILGETGKYADNHSPASVKGTTPLAGSVLTFLAVIYGYSASWSPIASDYYVQYPANVSRTKVFLLTASGISLSTCVCMWSGAIMASSLNNHPLWKQAYENDGIGYLIRDMLYPIGFAKFLLVLLVLSGICFNLLSTYSVSLTIQQFSPWVAFVPRIVVQVIVFGIVIALGLAGRKELNTYLQNFLSFLGYWSTSYFVILFLEHTFIRKRDFANYDLEGWNDRKRLPHGIAAATVFLVGVVCWVMGMAVTWYVGPLAGLFGENGGDVAIELTFVFTLVAYLPLRLLEIKLFHK